MFEHFRIFLLGNFCVFLSCSFKVSDLDQPSSTIPFPAWASSTQKSAFDEFSQHFPTLISNLRIVDGSGAPNKPWNRWGSNLECERHFPDFMENSANISSFQKLLVVKTLRPDRLHTAMQFLFCEVMFHCLCLFFCLVALERILRERHWLS